MTLNSKKDKIKAKEIQIVTLENKKKSVKNNS